MFKVNNKNTSTTSLIRNFEHILHLFLVLLLLNFNKYMLAGFVKNCFFVDITIVNPLQVTGLFLNPLKILENPPFLYPPPKTSENLTVFCFQAVEKGGFSDEVRWNRKRPVT